MEFVLLLGLGGSIEGPGDFGNGSSGDGGGNPDGRSRSAVQQVVSAQVQTHRRLNWRPNRQRTLIYLFIFRKTIFVKLH